jgi:predicted nucleic acid-binding protein
MICFFDTNILVCTVDAGDPQRRELATACLARAVREDTIALSTQVLQEFYSITTRKLKPPLSRREAAQQVRHLSAFEVVGATSASIVAATELAEKHQMQWWDALILEAALRANADVLYSEDGQHGQRFGPLTVTNPFV